MTKKPVIINLMLGSACNWKCEYCLQVKQPGFGKKIDVNQFCDRLLQYFQDNEIESIHRLNYWGGEPLLYKDVMYTVERRLSHITKHNSSRVITNGSLIDDQYIEFANQYNILTNISYHEGQLNDQCWEKALHIRRLYATSLISHQCLTWDDYFKKWQSIYDKFGRCIHWFVYPIHATEGVPQKYWLTIEDIDQYFEYLDWVVTKADNNTFYNRMLQILFFNYKKRNNELIIKNKCYNENTLSIDLQGNLYYCHHDCGQDNIANNIFDNNVWPEFSNMYSMGNQCQSCDIFDRCLGGCFRDLTPHVTCYYHKKMYKWLCEIKRDNPGLIMDRFYNMVGEDAV